MIKKILLGVLLVFLVTTISVFGYGYYKINQTVEKIQEPKFSTETKATTRKNLKPFNQKMNVLILGIDSGDLGRDEQGRSDSMFLGNFNFKANEHLLLGLERDTLVEIVGQGTEEKLNAAYSYGGEEMALQTVENLFNIEIPYYITINMKGFKSVLEVVGKIKVNNPFEFSYDGQVFKEGEIELEPEAALAWVRMRYDDPEGNLGRQKRQQELIEQVSEHLLKLENIYKIPKLIDVLGDNLETNIPVEELVKTVDFTTLKADIQMDQLKTENSYIDGISYELVQETEIMRLNTLMEENAAKE